MEWFSRRRIGLVAGMLLACVTLAAVCSFAPLDPTFTNLRLPKDGIGNWMGYPGALAGGSLVELFGWAALLLPCAIAYWTLCPVARPRWWRYVLQTLALLILAAAWSGQWTAEPALGLWSPGLAGWAGGRWVRDLTGPWISGALLTAGLALALWNQLYAPGMRSALTDIRAIGRLFTRQGMASAREWLSTRWAQAGTARTSVAAVVILAPVQALGGVLLVLGAGLRRWVAAPGAFVIERIRGSAASLSNIKARTATARLPKRRAAPAQGQGGERGDAAFDGWLTEDSPTQPQPAAANGGLDDFEHLTWRHPSETPVEDDGIRQPDPPRPSGAERLAEISRAAQANAPQPAPQPLRRPDLPPAGAGPERWEQLLRRYRENLDLDWDERSWRTSEESGKAGKPDPRGPKPDSK